MAPPREALQVRVGDEHRDGDRPQPADDRGELQHREQVHREGQNAERQDLRPSQRAGGELPARRPRVPRVELCVDEPVEAHRERARGDHRERDPPHGAEPRPPVDREQRADVRERQRKHRVLDADEAGEPDGKRSGQCGHTGSFVFETSTTPSMRIPLSTAFAMS